jgi:hypothetical protein
VRCNVFVSQHGGSASKRAPPLLPRHPCQLRLQTPIRHEQFCTCSTCNASHKFLATAFVHRGFRAKPGAREAVEGSAGGAKAAAAASSSVCAPSFHFGTMAPAATGTTTSNGFTFGTTAAAGGLGLSFGGFGAAASATRAAPAEGVGTRPAAANPDYPRAAKQRQVGPGLPRQRLRARKRCHQWSSQKS